jgi:hypothetical protein
MVTVAAILRGIPVAVRYAPTLLDDGEGGSLLSSRTRKCFGTMPIDVAVEAVAHDKGRDPQHQQTPEQVGPRPIAHEGDDGGQAIEQSDPYRHGDESKKNHSADTKQDKDFMTTRCIRKVVRDP